VRRLLRKVCERLPSGGGLLVVESYWTTPASARRGPVLQSLNMLVCTGGKADSVRSMQLLKEAGFARVEGWRTETPLDAVLAIKE
jgi:hypothetical protein